MSANLENSAAATAWEKISFHSNSKEGQCQRMFRLPYSCTHFTRQQAYTQHPSSQTLAVHEPRTARCTSQVSKRQKNQRSNCQHSLEHGESKGISEKNIYLSSVDYTKAFDCVEHNKLWKILEEMGILDHLTCLLRNLYAVKKQQLEPYMEQRTGSELGREFQKAVYFHLVHLTYMQSTS